MYTVHVYTYLLPELPSKVSYFRTFKVLYTYSTCMCTCSSEDDSVSGFFFKLSWSIKLATVLSERTHRTRKRARQLSK